LDLSFLTYYADNPIALVALGIVAALIIYTWKVLPLKIEKMWLGKTSGKEESKSGQKTDAIKKEGFIPHLDKILDRIETKIDNMEKRLNHVDKSGLMGVIYNRHIHTTDRLRAFNSYIKLGGNGLVAKFAIEKLVLPNRDDWIRVVQESHMKTYCEKYYEERIAEISKKISQIEGE